MSDEPHEPPEEEDDDALLRALGALAREREAEAEADDAWPADDEALRPLDEAEAAMLMDAVLGAEVRAEPPPSPATLTPPRRRGWVWAGVVGALAAALLLAIGLRGPDALPDYRLTAGAGEQTFRADPEAPAADGRARYTTGSRVQLVARPASDVPDPVVARVYVRQGGQTTRLDPPVQVSPTGAVRLDAVAGETLPLPEGEGELILLVRPTDLGTDDAELLQAADPRPARRLTHEFSFSR